ncbi:MAG: type II toxin-antitoxin system RelE/ParE family toxin [Desulfobulbaceae bacterium]|nr:type II toxin-antitoxin system RelE/ParE family toxin [Desulfobulbaceae bacterium]
MSSQYNVFWTSAAESDLSNIIFYIAEESPVNARTIFDKIQEKASSLRQFPERGRIVPELQDQGVNLYREIIVSPWRIVYRISEKKIYVLTVFDSRQNAEDVLLKKLTA